MLKHIMIKEVKLVAIMQENKIFYYALRILRKASYKFKPYYSKLKEFTQQATLNLKKLNLQI